MQFRVVTLFPEMVETGVSFGVCGRAVRRGLVELATVDPRDFAADAHRTVDDRPYGGGPGMVLKVEPFRDAIHDAKAGMPAGSPVVFLTPQGRCFDQRLAEQLAALPGMVLVAGRYEGFDERLIEVEGDDEISLGDFVLSGGEIVAMAVIDAVVRLLPGVLGDAASAELESYADDLLDFPQYTRPEIVDGVQVPEVLRDGNHDEIRRWRLKHALGRTFERRPDLLAGRTLTEEERQLLGEYLAEKDLRAGDTGRIKH
ncbi:MAG: tRNA (guanosine(37)-N1)-methyltransferase TrmD [Gammaproteobacteria bacterium]